MPRIVWEGNQKWDKEFRDEPLPREAKEIHRPDDIIKSSWPYMILPCVVCTASVFFKTRARGGFLFDPWFIPLSFLLGFLAAMPLHEYLHALCYPREATVYVGVCLGRLRAYAVSFFPITRMRFLVMSLAPAIPGVLALLLFWAAPMEAKILHTLCIVPAYMSLISPAPDYQDVLQVFRQVPWGGMVQASNEGLFWFFP